MCCITCILSPPIHLVFQWQATIMGPVSVMTVVDGSLRTGRGFRTLHTTLLLPAVE